MSASPLVTSPPAEYDEALMAVLERRLLDCRGMPVRDRAADETLQRVASTSLRLQLASRRAKGLSGWHIGLGKSARFQEELQNAIANGHMPEALRLVAVLYVRKQLYGPEA